MHTTPFATFESEFPDDSVEERGDIVVPGGQNIMRDIYERLAAQGYLVSNFDQHSHYGWSFDLRGPEGNFWLLIQNPGPWLLTVHDSRMFWSRLFRKGQGGFAALIAQCSKCLSSIPEISAISWMSRREFEEKLHRKTTQS
ncbi:MAG: hypothetical protein ACAH88_09140 [Roseimicrobium sp.]